MPKYLAHVLIDTDLNGSDESYPETVPNPAQEAADFVDTFGGSPGSQWDEPFRAKILGVEPMLGVSGRTQEALTQCQRIAYDGSLMVDNFPYRGHLVGLHPEICNYLRALEAKIDRIANIAEAGEPDEDWEPLHEDEHGDVDGGEAVSISGEEIMAEREPDPEAGDMSTSDGLGADSPSPGRGLVDRLARDYEYDPDADGSVDQLIDYKNALEERLVDTFDASMPYVAAIRRLRKWVEDPETDGEDPIEMLTSTLRDLGAIPQS